MRLAILAILVSGQAAFAQDQAIQRELIRREQQSDAFRLQLQQSQERLNTPPGDLRRRQEIEARQLGERQRLETTAEHQILEVERDTPAELRPYERDRAQQERRALAEPSQPPIMVPPEPPRPLPMPGEPRSLVLPTP